MDVLGAIFLVVVVGAAVGLVYLWRSNLQLEARGETAELARESYQRQAGEALARIEERSRALSDLEHRYLTLEGEKTALSVQVGTLREAHGRATSAAEGAAQRALRLEQELQSLNADRHRLMDDKAVLASKASELAALLEAERTSSAEKLALLGEAKEQLSTQFKLLASEILEEKRKDFTAHSQTSLDTLLKPLGTTMDEFRKRIDQIHTEETQQRASLSREVKLTFELNQTLAKGAQELTRALKGSNKVQGNWGERVLESVLESSGLRHGQEYNTQVSCRHEDGTRGLPDVVINLPGARHLVVDSKVSLTAYQEYVNTEPDVDREAALKRHLDSMRAHIKGLSAKNYPDLYEIRTLDFVLLFIPIEPAFMLAAQADPGLFEDAWKRNIILVSPSTLQFVLRTVASLWRQEQQSQNAQEIAKKGGELYDKVVGFITEMDKLGRHLESAQQSFTDVRSKLVTGRGSVTGRAQQLLALGVKSTKQLPAELVEKAEEDVELNADKVFTGLIKSHDLLSVR